MQDPKTQDRLERAIYFRMIEKDESFFEAVEMIDYLAGEFGGKCSGASDFSATFEIWGDEYDVDPGWLLRRNYPS